MIAWLAVLLLPLTLQGALAPPMPLVPGDPLELAIANREALFGRDHVKRNEQIFQSRQIPFFGLLAAVGLMCALPWALKHWQEKQRQKKIVHAPLTLEELLKALNTLEKDPALDSKMKIYQLSSILRMQCTSLLGKPCEPLTWQEIALEWKKKGLQDTTLLQTLANTDHLSFRPERPTPQEWQKVLHASTEAIKKSLNEILNG